MDENKKRKEKQDKLTYPDGRAKEKKGRKKGGKCLAPVRKPRALKSTVGRKTGGLGRRPLAPRVCDEAGQKKSQNASQFLRGVMC
jgi:hypothetical protein